MADISIQNLQDIAVKATTDFFNGTPLNESLAKQASDLDLNSDQLKRAIEATNTLTFLKSAEVHKDKTVEFPLADYNEIMKIACVPQSLITKSANVEVKDRTEQPSFSDMVKSAESKLGYELPSMSQDQLIKQIYKSAQINKLAIQNLEDELVRCSDKFIKIAKELSQSPAGFEQLSASSADNVMFSKIAKLVFPEKGARKDYAGFIYKSAGLVDAEELVSTYSRLSEIDKELGLRKEAQAKVVELEKAGFFTLGQVGKALAWPFKAGKSVATGVKNLATKPAETLGKATGAAITYPVKTLGNVVANTASGTGKILKTKAQNAFAGTGLGKALKVPKVEMPQNIKRNISALGVVGGAAMNASSFTPKVDPANGNMGDVWTAIRN